MPVITAATAPDLITTTLADLGRLKFTDLISDYQNTIAMKRLIKKEKANFQSGYAVRFNVMTNHNNSARGVGLYHTVNVDPNSTMTYGQIEWRHQHWNWSFDKREVSMNREPAKIVDLLKERRIAALASAIIYYERNFWRVPDVTNTVDFFGVPYFVVKSNLAATAANNDGFNGGNPSGYSDVSGLSPTVYKNWRNYATQYTTVSKDDLIQKMRRMCTYTDFMPLVDEIPEYNTGNDYGLYTNYAVLGTVEQLLEAQNENLGADIASMDGRAVFRRTPFTWVKELDKDTTNPVYSLNWGELSWAVLNGHWMLETTFERLPHQPLVSVTYTDCTGQLVCRNRRRQGVLATDVTMAY
jgi:hypothetical protein